MSFGKVPRLNIWIGHVDRWHHHQTIIWVIRSLHWLWRLAFICVFSLCVVHHLTTGANKRRTTCPPPECYQLHERPSSNFIISSNCTLFSMNRIYEATEVLNCVIPNSSKWDYEKSRPSPKRPLSLLVTLTKIEL